MNYLIYIPFGLLPSIIWLLFYLRKDAHPESNVMVLKIFFYGAVSAVAAAFLELEIFKVIDGLILKTFLGVALIEEVIKYLVVRWSVLRNQEFDEPLDTMLYMIIAALGFAALENILILWAQEAPFYLFETFAFTVFRFLGATFLHALCSGALGYFLARSLYDSKKRIWLFGCGLILAIFLHGVYNFSIMNIKGNQRFIIPVIILIALALFVSWGFKKLKRLKSICLTRNNHQETITKQ